MSEAHSLAPLIVPFRYCDMHGPGQGWAGRSPHHWL